MTNVAPPWRPLTGRRGGAVSRLIGRGFTPTMGTGHCLGAVVPDGSLLLSDRAAPIEPGALVAFTSPRWLTPSVKLFVGWAESWTIENRAVSAAFFYQIDPHMIVAVAIRDICHIERVTHVARPGERMVALDIESVMNAMPAGVRGLVDAFSGCSDFPAPKAGTLRNGLVDAWKMIAGVHRALPA